MLSDKLLARLAEMGDAPDHQLLAAEVLGIRGAPPELAQRLVAQALVLEDRREIWRRPGERICRDAPPTPGVYVLQGRGRPRALRRQGGAPAPAPARAFRRAAMARAEARAVARRGRRVARGRLRDRGAAARGVADPELQPPVNVQIGAPDLDTREVPRALRRDVLVVQPSIEADSVELDLRRASTAAG